MFLNKGPRCPHIETSQLICFENQLTGFYMRATLAVNGKFDNDIAGLVIFEKSEVSSANRFALKRNPCGKPLM